MNTYLVPAMWFLWIVGLFLLALGVLGAISHSAGENNKNCKAALANPGLYLMILGLILFALASLKLVGLSHQ